MKKIGKLETIFNKIMAKRFSKKEKIFLLIVFFISAGYLLFYINKLTNSLKEEIKIVEPVVSKYIPKTSTKVTEQLKLAIKESASLMKKPDLRDPFLASKDSNIINAPSESKKPLINLNLKGILMDKLVPSAIINSKVVKIGDLIYGKTVVDIEKNKVILMENGEIQILELKKIQ